MMADNAVHVGKIDVQIQGLGVGVCTAVVQHLQPLQGLPCASFVAHITIIAYTGFCQCKQRNERENLP